MDVGSSSASSTWAFYYLQAEDGEDRSHPNAFRIPKPSSAEITLSDIHAHFPLGNPHAFHFRFRMNSAKGDTFFWMDVISPSQVVPLVNGRVISKVLRLNRPKPVGLVLHRKPVFQWIDSLPPKSVSHQGRSAQPTERPQKYSDAPPRSVVSPKPQQQPQPAQQSTESFEDFLSSGGGSNNASKPKPAVDLMGDSWQAPQQPPPAAPAFAPPRPKTPPKVAAPPKNFEDDGGQTVGPVTLAEMEQHKVSSDGSQVYNPDLVDKSTKSASVRAAMEERERIKAAEIERARLELVRRDQEKAAMDQAKAQSGLVLGPKMKLWAEDNGRKKNIRTLLSTMHQVMWADSKWTEVNMAKLLTPNDVKKVYRRAIMVVHPDKAGGRTADQLFVSERIFDALNTAWDEFARTEIK
ncbi:hypothetical protein LEN26_006042 [Aphanomyces euteiches]|nr:hypothetical protein AeMF1_011904 [Aphanomyces euteiches]KAH9136687.1 hypothetical protein LEN26_006042 [Aphanomyces euteiches]